MNREPKQSRVTSWSALSLERPFTPTWLWMIHAVLTRLSDLPAGCFLVLKFTFAQFDVSLFLLPRTADTQLLLEPGTATVQAPLFDSTGNILSAVFPAHKSLFGKPPSATPPPKDAPLFVFIVCGGSGVTLERIEGWHERLGTKPSKITREQLGKVIVRSWDEKEGVKEEEFLP